MTGPAPGWPLAAAIPLRVCEVELSQPLPPLPAAATAQGGRPGAALVLARWYSEPLALASVPLDGGHVTPERLASELWPQVRGPLLARLRAAGAAVPARLPAAGLRAPQPVPYLRRRAEVLATAPPVSVIVCTRGRGTRVAACLDALAAQEYPDFEIVVVDNAPVCGEVENLIASWRPPVPARRVVESRPGLAWARNAGLAAAAGDILAYLDDDERPDRHWLAEMARGFTLAPQVAGVSGIVLPAALDTLAQRWFEQFGGHSKGRGFAAEIFDQASHARQHPLYPLPPFGTGASLAFTRDALLGIGGFDVALGAGTPARAGEDTAAIADLMLAGATFVYWPGAIMWHEHRRETAELAAQLRGYGTGLTAFYTRAVMRDPAVLPRLVRLAPQAVRDLRRPGCPRFPALGDGYPARLRRARRRGMLAGPLCYLRSRRLQARVAEGTR
jgi:glycosyltransferase involved in cell wall biosynthesis